jgi:hypothetical protein
VLGEGSFEEVASWVEARAETYDALNGGLDAVPALHFVYGVAQPQPGRDGLYLQYAGAADLEAAIEVTRERGMLLFIDLQIGRSSVAAEVAKVLPYLRQPHVHLALDPEFALAAPDVPGERIGGISGRDINEAQSMLQDVLRGARLPAKLLVVHQFLDTMITDADAITPHEGVELVIDMDGFGPAEIKRVKYERYASQAYAQRPAIKLFFQHDPDLMSEADVAGLSPMPSVVIYQ